MDSGSSINGINVEKYIPGATVVPSDAEHNNATYACANGSVLNNKGQTTTDVRFEKADGYQRQLTWQNVDIEMPIISTACLADDPEHQSDVMYGRDGGQIIEVQGDKRSNFIRNGSVYFVKTYLKQIMFERPNKAPGFVRPGAGA